MIKKTILFLFLSLVCFSIQAGEPTSSDNKEGFNPTPQILHHIQDSYEWHLWGDVSIPLPVILYTEGNFDVFMSSEFNHGKSTVIKGDRNYKIDHHHIIEANHKEFFNLSITKNVASMIFSVILLFFLLRKAALSYKNTKESPKGLQAFFRAINFIC